MPNHITNQLTIEGKPERVKEIFEFIQPGQTIEESKPLAANGKKGLFKPATTVQLAARGTVTGHDKCIDFQKIVPMPPTVYRGDLGKKEEEQYGKENCWYDWSVKNWGTKWNAYDTTRINASTIQFDTAWSMPHPVMVALSRLYKDVTVKVRWADEDTGCNCGELHLKNGEELHCYLPEKYTKEAYDFCFEVRPDAKEWYKYDKDKGNYVSTEE